VEVALDLVVASTASSTRAQHPVPTPSVPQEGSFTRLSGPLATLGAAPAVHNALGAGGVRDDLRGARPVCARGGRVAGHDEADSGKESHRHQKSLSVNRSHDVLVDVLCCSATGGL